MATVVITHAIDMMIDPILKTHQIVITVRATIFVNVVIWLFIGFPCYILKSLTLILICIIIKILIMYTILSQFKICLIISVF